MNPIILSTKPDISKLPGGWEPDEVPLLTETTSVKLISNPPSIILENVFSENECSSLIALMDRSPNIEPVTVQGRKITKEESIGSVRTTIWSVQLAEQIWHKIKKYIPERIMDEKTPTDWWQNDKNRRHWKPIMCSPISRFMKYEKEGQHYPHYDVGFIYGDDAIRTLQSVVIYLTTSKEGGATRFIKDGQKNLPVWKHNQDDWTREAKDEEVINQAAAIIGNVLIFDHGLCHDVKTHLDKEPRIIIRTDIIFEAINNLDVTH
jgi:hypothetical protein